MFDNPAFDGHETVVHTYDQNSGLCAIVAVHNTQRGPSLGGVRAWTYANATGALTDALRLSRAMTYKAAMADLPLGGGKAVLMLPGRGAKTPGMFEALGEMVDGLGGRYIAAEDIGSTPDDMKRIAARTRHVTGLPLAAGGRGDPSPATADGVFAGVAATARAIGRDLCNLHVTIQGLGNVGFGLAARLRAAGARLTVADIDRTAVRRAVAELGATVVDVRDIAAVEADIFSPNALGSVLNRQTIAQLKVAAVAGAANNQLATPEDGEFLRARGILYAPDYVLNAGGVIKMCADYFGWDDAAVRSRIDGIGDRLEAIFAEASRRSEPTSAVADRMAEARFQPPRLLARTG
ncbi:Glu/Leu/Phe/Val dehydrogenase dimerization domain-containing protein [Acuticoccus sp. MNP-M23]|uniref:Glu/Leu/Phe/Val dehydrogenase dimerization domain-containing protein n=1 Tax=Acuticoccus sp. MNP-M23 TaxID=3072793 RepID=UPI002814F5E9|nr:Glu/Leu/Phe/Val dehydrogenase dimerization domain-containing protein [Acuticoccus sp. MNP-M23]WMS43707.1 Glu/Leu/Phe/Val dehydrogenase dimerization domain-containing protein [Acuticoccus sp. MNP-M23]